MLDAQIAPGAVSDSTAPTGQLMTAALAGLLMVQGMGCGAAEKKKADPQGQTSPDAGTEGANEDAGPGADAGPTGPVIISEVEGDRTYASLKADCDKRGGYTQVHAACAATNACKGFSYGDWNPGVLTEHTCAGANGCNGISCIVLPEDSGKTGKEVLMEELPLNGPAGCTTCHTVTNDDGSDAGKFKLYVLPGSARTAANWLDTPASTQELTVAFGSQGITADGIAVSNMRGYHKLYSRAEIERVVEYIRTELTVEVHEYRLADPSMP